MTTRTLSTKPNSPSQFLLSTFTLQYSNGGKEAFSKTSTSVFRVERYLSLYLRLTETEAKDHDFFIHKERGFKPLVKTAGPTQKSEKKLKVSTHTGGCSHLRDSRARTKRHQLTVAHRVDSPNLRATPLTTGLNSNPVRSFRSRMIRARAGAVRRRRSAAVEPSRERVARGEEVYSSK